MQERQRAQERQTEERKRYEQELLDMCQREVEAEKAKQRAIKAKLQQDKI